MNKVNIADAGRQLPQLVQRAADGREIVILTSQNQPRAVLIGVEAFEHLIGMHAYTRRPLGTMEALQRDLRQALAEAGYDSRESIVKLVREVKREAADEREAQRKSGH